MMGGEWFYKLFGSPDQVSEETLERVAVDACSQHLGFKAAPRRVLVEKWTVSG